MANKHGHAGTEIPFCTINDVRKYKHITLMKCAAAKDFFIVCPVGNIHTCNHSPRIVGHIFGKPLIEDAYCWNMFAKSDYSPAKCSECKMTNLYDCSCREVANILHGSSREKDSSIII